MLAEKVLSFGLKPRGSDAAFLKLLPSAPDSRADPGFGTFDMLDPFGHGRIDVFPPLRVLSA
jgi:hypothetical protein